MTPDPDGVMPLSEAEFEREMLFTPLTPHEESWYRSFAQTHPRSDAAVAAGRLLATLDAARAPHDAPALDRERPDTDDALALLDELRARFDQGHMLSWQDLLLAALGDVRLPETGLRDMLDRHSVFDPEDGNYRVEAGTYNALRAALSVPATGPEGLDVERLAEADYNAHELRRFADDPDPWENQGDGYKDYWREHAAAVIAEYDRLVALSADATEGTG